VAATSKRRERTGLLAAFRDSRLCWPCRWVYAAVAFSTAQPSQPLRNASGRVGVSSTSWLRAGCVRSTRNDLAGVEDVVGIEQALDAALKLESFRSKLTFELIHFE